MILMSVYKNVFLPITEQILRPFLELYISKSDATILAITLFDVTKYSFGSNNNAPPLTLNGSYRKYRLSTIRGRQ